jgi:peptidylprolyl isomerase
MKTLLLASFGLAVALAGCKQNSTDKTITAEASASASAAAARASASAAGRGPRKRMPRPDAIPAPEDVAAAPADAEKTASGLQSKVLTPGTGTKKPTPTDKVKVNYTGWTKDGMMFDSSIPRHEPTSFGVSEVIKGWTEGLQLMVEGEKRRFWIPAALAYGETPRGGAPSGDLTFDVELLEVKEMPKPPPVPDDVKEAPKTATKTASGLKYKVLKASKTGDKPTATQVVTVNYSGWTTDGKMFDSSIPRGEPTTFGVSQVIKGWTEGLQLMKVGETFRFWIPAELAYGEKPSRPGAPAGLLVFDVELLGIKGPPAGPGSARPTMTSAPPH